MHERLIEAFETRAYVDGSKDLLTHLMPKTQMTRNDVCKPPHVLHDRDRNKCLRRDLVGELHPFLKLARNSVNECLHLLAQRPLLHLIDLVHICLSIGIALTDGKDLCTFLPIDKNAQNSLGHAQELTNLCNGSDIVEIVRRWVIILRIPLCHDEDLAVPRDGALNGSN